MRGILAVALLAMLSGQSLGVTCSRLNSEWQTYFYNDFKIVGLPKTFHCPSVSATIAQAMHDVKSVRFTKNEAGYAPDFYAFSKALIKKTVYEPSEEKCDALASMSATGRMRICKGFETASREWVAATIVHEAAHNRSVDLGHVKCKHGSRKGEYACDRVFHEGFQGSGYNYSFMFHWWTSEASDYPELSNEVSRSIMRYLLLNRFNSVPEDKLKKWIS